MRTKILLLIIGIVLLALFAVLNVDEITRTSTLNLGFTTTQMPLGLLLLMLVVALRWYFWCLPFTCTAPSCLKPANTPEN